MTSTVPSQIPHLQSLARLIRYLCVTATSTADSGHLTSSLSAADLMTGLLFGGTFRFTVDDPEHPNNDRLILFVSTFAAFFTRAFDQIRMSQYSHPNLKFVGSHAGVSIGEDGASQMGLEDIAMFRSVLTSTVLHPCDATSTERLVETAAAVARRRSSGDRS